MSERWRKVLLYVGVALAILAPRLGDLDQFVTADEHLWLTASGNFYTALAQREPAETYRFEAPAVTTMWAGLAGYLIEAPEYRGWGQGYMERELTEDLFARKGIDPLDILATGRLFVVLQVAAALLAAFYYAERLWGWVPALAGMLMLAFDPFYIALTRLLHMDGLLSAYVLLAALGLAGYLYQERRRIDLIVSGAAAGLAMLSKSPGAFIMPFAAVLLLAAFWRGEDRSWKAFWELALRPGLGWGLAAAATFTVLWPAMWVAPVETVNRVFVWALEFASKGHDTPIFFNGQALLPSEMGLGVLSFYPITYAWRTTPVALLGLAMAVYLYIRKEDIFTEETARRAGSNMMWLAVLFMVFMMTGKKQFDRYLLPTYLPLDMLAGLGWVGIAHAGKRWSESWARPWSGAVLAAGLVWQLALALPHAPYYFTYYNPLLGGPKRAGEVMMLGWGEGLDEAGRYLAAQPNAAELEIQAWYAEGSFSYFFPGTSYNIVHQPHWDRANARNLVVVDYVVIYVHQWQRGMPQALLDVLAQIEPEHTVTLAGIEYVKIYDINDISEDDMIELAKAISAPLDNGDE